MPMNFHLRLAAPLALAVAALAGCGNVSRNIAPDGRTADLAWPKTTDATPMHKGGTFPSRDNLIRLRAGLNKGQVADLIGYPHFNEGVWHIREWNYVFNFAEPSSDSVVTCQFKALFDVNGIARSFYWEPSDCARFQHAEAASPGPPAPPETERFVLSTDALFAFDRSSVNDIKGGGEARLDQLANDIQHHGSRVQGIRVIGYTDNIGGDSYNDDLSQKRADAVKSYLASRGIDPGLIQAEGRGKADPVVECGAEKARDALIGCLAPNRRVVILINAVGRGNTAH